MGNIGTSKYINPLTDYGFKKIFGDEEIMRAFLNDLLEPSSPITKITFLDKEMVAETENERGVIYDLRCETSEGKKFIVEMQNKSQSHFSDRIIYYLSRSFSTQEEIGDLHWKFDIEPVYGIFFLNFHLAGLEPKAKRTIKVMVEETKEVFTDKVCAYTLELPSFRNKPQSFATNKIEYWLYNLANMETMTQAIPYQDKQPAFEKVSNIAEIVKLNPDELNKYNISLDTYRDSVAVMDYVKEEGIQEGRQQGLQEGRQQGIQEGIQQGLLQGRQQGIREGILLTAKKMKDKGMPFDDISKVTGLSKEELENL